MDRQLSEWAAMIDDCVTREARLSEWEREFVASILDRMERGEPLSKKQSDKLSSVWDRVTEKG